ncbi:hypothetical protein ACUXAV_000318 [Cupriavidus metallidurans]|uniref:hypothetical protein n=1 Tax=Cupriavidus metallidurans TaxID=119219 RepID=UPI0004935821|nr:hypothetical protein [Cupriavidus metallidurans]MDE4918279.1 hypothetical protein [Cupriavidus metallidurans]
MTEKLLLVAGDTGPDVVIPLSDANSGTPINLSDAGTTVVVEMFPVGDSAVRFTLPCAKIAGKENDDGSIDLSGSYGLPGGGGRVLMHWTAEALQTAGLYKAQVVVTFGNGVRQTTYELTPIKIRERTSG